MFNEVQPSADQKLASDIHKDATIALSHEPRDARNAALINLQREAQALLPKPGQLPDGRTGDTNSIFRYQVTKDLSQMNEKVPGVAANTVFPIRISEKGTIDAVYDDSIGTTRNGMYNFVTQREELVSNGSDPAQVLLVGSPWKGPEAPVKLAREIQNNVENALNYPDQKVYQEALAKDSLLLAPPNDGYSLPSVDSSIAHKVDVENSKDYQSAVRDALATLESPPESSMYTPHVFIDDAGIISSSASVWLTDKPGFSQERSVTTKPSNSNVVETKITNLGTPYSH